LAHHFWQYVSIGLFLDSFHSFIHYYHPLRILFVTVYPRMPVWELKLTCLRLGLGITCCEIAITILLRSSLVIIAQSKEQGLFTNRNYYIINYSHTITPLSPHIQKLMQKILMWKKAIIPLCTFLTHIYSISTKHSLLQQSGRNFVESHIVCCTFSYHITILPHPHTNSFVLHKSLW